MKILGRRQKFYRLVVNIKGKMYAFSAAMMIKYMTKVGLKDFWMCQKSAQIV